MVKQQRFFSGWKSLVKAILVCLTLASCAGESLHEPALKTAALVGSTEADAELIEQSTGNVFELTIEGAKILPEFTAEQITSVCALAFYNELSEEQRRGNCFVKVNISEDKEKPIRATYSCDELIIADRCIDNVSTYFRWHPSLGLDSIRHAVDPTFFPDSILVFMGQRIPLQDSADYTKVRTEILGFSRDTTANIPVLVLKSKVIQQGQTKLYDVYARYSSQQILFVAAKLGKSK
jgi:hypothetical protein